MSVLSSYCYYRTNEGLANHPQAWQLAQAGAQGRAVGVCRHCWAWAEVRLLRDCVHGFALG